MDKKTLKEITQRVNAYYKQSNKNRTDKEHLDAHIDALVEVFNVNREEIQDIANQVLAQQEKNTNKPWYITNLSKLLIGIAFLIVIVAITMLSTQLNNLQKQTEFSLGMTSSGANSQGANSTVTLLTPDTSPQAQSVTPNYHHYLQQSIFAEILTSIVPIRMYLLEHYQLNGKYPSSLEELGLNREDMQTGKYIQDLKLGSGGQILVKATEQLGDDIFISLTPKTVMGGLNTEWVCESNFKQKYASCEYVHSKTHQIDYLNSGHDKDYTNIKKQN